MNYNAIWMFHYADQNLHQENNNYLIVSVCSERKTKFNRNCFAEMQVYVIRSIWVYFHASVHLIRSNHWMRRWELRFASRQQQISYYILSRLLWLATNQLYFFQFSIFHPIEFLFSVNFIKINNSINLFNLKTKH